MRVLILGATGFIGGHIARQASEAEMEVHALRRRPDSVGAIPDVPVTWHEGDLRDAASLLDAMRGCEVVFHAAGYYPRFDHTIHAAMEQASLSLRTVFNAAQQAGIRRMIYTSSLTTIGEPPPGEDRMADERDLYVPGSVATAYFEAKWVMECEALRASQRSLEVITLIPTIVFGPGDVKPTTGEVLQRIAKRQLPVGLDLTANIVDGRDVAAAHVAAATRGDPGERYIIGGGNYSMADALRQTAEIAGVPPPRWNLSLGVASRLFRVAQAVRYPIPDLLMGIGHIRPLNDALGQRMFGFAPRPLEETLRDTITWFQEHGYV